MRYLVDSNIIIYHLNSELSATNFLKQYQNHIAISIITYIEVLSFDFTISETKYVEKLLSKFKILDIDMNISQQAISNRKSRKIKLPDNLILSTAMRYNLTLVTRNTKDFIHFDIQLHNPIKV
jgi:predicted nucleic acid-binding protein